MKMEPLRELSFVVDVTGGADTVLETLAKDYQVEESHSGSGSEIFFDTFDWRLHRKKIVLSNCRGSLVLKDFNGKEICRSASRRTARFFWWDLNDSGLKTMLRKHAGVRALSPNLSFNFSTRTFRVMNSDRKTVLRLTSRQSTVQSEGSAMELPEIISLQEIRGYEKPYSKALALMPPSVRPLERYIDIIDEAYGVADRQPLDYGAKFEIDLDPDIPVGAAVSKICLKLVHSMEVNRPGVIDDIDSEFLHDFRIAIRRTRSLMSLLRKVLPQERIRPFESEFRWLGNVTGPVRDIDVYLLMEEEYKNRVPDSLASGLDLFFSTLAADREEKLAALRQALSSERYEKLIVSWREFLLDRDSVLHEGKRARPLKPLIDGIIRKRFRSFIKDGDLISDKNGDRSLHKLRIKGKKFRYLLEFFRAFYKRDDVEMFLKHMKKLQDNLGDFNDLSVQMDMLEQTLFDLKARNKQTVLMAASLGSLIAGLKDSHRQTRSRFRKTYEAFRIPENRELIERMTSSERQKSGAETKK